MLNTDTFLSRLAEIMENYQLNAAAFAERIGVQRSSVSHILSKRNKPSLEFVLKIYHAFEEVQLDWLLLERPDSALPPTLGENVKEEQREDSAEKEEKPELSVKQALDGDKEAIVQIIQLYEDGSFRSFFPKS